MRHNNKWLFFVFLTGFTALIFSSIYLGNVNEDKNTDIVNKNTVVTEKQSEDKKEIEEEEVETQQPKPISGLLIGYDESGQLTDVIMVAILDPVDNEFKLLSMPRDLYIDYTLEPFKSIKESVSKSKIRYCKLTESYGYLGRDEEALEAIRSIVKGIVGFDIDYIASINLSAFREMVDTVGGVEFDVPANMWTTNFDDSGVKKGWQLLNGEKAEMLVRYRTYPRGDLQRIEVQQQFLSALIKKVLEIEDWAQVMEIMQTTYTHVKTDLKFFDVLKYAEYFKNVDQGQLLVDKNRTTIPSYSKKIEGKWYQLWDREEVRSYVETFVNGEPSTENQEVDRQSIDNQNEYFEHTANN